MSSPRTTTLTEPLVYDASCVFRYNEPVERSGQPLPFPGKDTSSSSSIVDDWNRGIWPPRLDAKEQVGISITLKDEREPTALWTILENLDEKKKEIYEIKPAPESTTGKLKFTSIKGLKEFWRDCLFHEMSDKKQQDILLASAEEDLHQSGLPYAADVMFAPYDRVLMQSNEQRPTLSESDVPIMIYHPIQNGVAIKAVIPYSVEQDKKTSQNIQHPLPLISMSLTTSLVLGKDDKIDIPKGNLEVTIHDERLKDFVLGRGFISDYLEEYRKNKDNYHSTSDKKEILDLFMDEISGLYDKNQDQAAISLFYIYSALKDLDFSKPNTLEIYLKTFDDHAPQLYSAIISIHKKYNANFTAGLIEEEQKIEHQALQSLLQSSPDITTLQNACKIWVDRVAALQTKLKLFESTDKVEELSNTLIGLRHQPQIVEPESHLKNYDTDKIDFLQRAIRDAKTIRSHLNDNYTVELHELKAYSDQIQPFIIHLQSELGSLKYRAAKQTVNSKLFLESIEHFNQVLQIDSKNLDAHMKRLNSQMKIVNISRDNLQALKIALEIADKYANEYLILMREKNIPNKQLNDLHSTIKAEIESLNNPKSNQEVKIHLSQTTATLKPPTTEESKIKASEHSDPSSNLMYDQGKKYYDQAANKSGNEEIRFLNMAKAQFNLVLTSTDKTNPFHLNAQYHHARSADKLADLLTKRYDSDKTSHNLNEALKALNEASNSYREYTTKALANPQTQREESHKKAILGMITAIELEEQKLKAQRAPKSVSTSRLSTFTPSSSAPSQVSPTVPKKNKPG